MQKKEGVDDVYAYRKVLGHFASGVTVVMTVYEGVVHGMTVNSFCSISLDPPLVLISVNTISHMHRLLAQSKRYVVNVLSRDQEILSRHFAGQAQEDLCIPFLWFNGSPLLDGALAHLICRVTHIYPVGDHTLYVGLVEYIHSSDGSDPLLFYRGEYRSLEEQPVKAHREESQGHASVRGV